MPVGMWVSRIADSVLFTCCCLLVHFLPPHCRRRVKEWASTYLSTRTPRSHHFDFDILLLKQIPHIRRWIPILSR